MFLLFITCLWETFCCIRACCTNISGLICRCFKYQGRFFRWIPKALARKLSNTQLPLGTAFSFWAQQVSVPSSRAGDFQCNPVLAEIPGTVRSKEKKKSPWLLHFISFSNYSRQFLLGLFKICMIGIFASLWKARDILNCISSLESAGTSSWTPRGSWGCSPEHGAPRFLQIPCESVLVLGEETNCCCLRSLLGPSVQRKFGKCRFMLSFVWQRRKNELFVER